MEPALIRELDDPRVAAYRNVRDAELRSGASFLAEGRLNVRRLLTAQRFRARSVFVTPAGLAGIRDALAQRSDETSVYLASPELMSQVVGYAMHRGCLAEGLRGADPGFEALLGADGSPPRLSVALEHVTNPDNVGAIFRNALAFGAGGVLLTPRCVDPLYRKSIRVSMGATLKLPFARATAWPAELARLREAGVHVLALETRGAPPLSAFSLPASARGAALLVGSEETGLSLAARAQVSERVSIPMAPGIDSLNAATATGIALHRLSELLARSDA